jgi:hypothetical protein
MADAAALSATSMSTSVSRVRCSQPSTPFFSGFSSAGGTSVTASALVGSGSSPSSGVSAIIARMDGLRKSERRAAMMAAPMEMTTESQRSSPSASKPQRLLTPLAPLITT